MKRDIDRLRAFVPKESLTLQEEVELINKLLDRHFKVYNRLAEI
ncbi:MAG: hypothetical protein OXC46_03410 [Thaumarchaeota archaeon]|nr:hypothetical protein [Nitrososphaerota archaeon]